LADNISGSVHNLEMARNCGLLDQLLKDEMILTDKIYIGETCFIYLSNKLQLFKENNSILFLAVLEKL
jgi:hypothetical protein